ncbi:hypothetical protein LNN38_25435 [Pseudomonas sp. LA21]|uniref:hypothetical protein n=1 Tax=Pseudomonas sp. LA21 TaxID=2893373 RepID=UPI001FB8607B|nr:hypothetical protein [Pseudomonas sp. LA21]MCJ1888221.1 hypothetical protein [Pseudomonas sp. LA21]
MNLTNSPRVLLSDFFLNILIHKLIQDVVMCIDGFFEGGRFSTYESITAAASGKSIKVYFKKMLLLAPRANERTYSASWVQLAYKYCGGELNAAELHILLGGGAKDYKESARKDLKKGIWLLLVGLYREGAIELPASFRMYSSTDPAARAFGKEFYSELMSFSQSAVDRSEEEFWRGEPKPRRGMFASYATKYFWMTGATTPEQLKLEDVVTVYQAFMWHGYKLFKHFPVIDIFERLFRRFPGRINFTRDELKERIRFIKKSRADERISVLVERGGAKDGEEEYIQDLPLAVCKGFTMAAYTPSRVADREFYKPQEKRIRQAVSVWAEVQMAYFAYKNYEVKISKITGICLLNIYLFEYLPRHFKGGRYPVKPTSLGAEFISGSVVEVNKPLSLLNFCKVMSSGRKDGGYSNLNQIKGLFSWISSNSSGYGAFRGFVNYLEDAPLPRAEKRSETNKRPFSPSQYFIALVYMNSLFNLVRLLNERVLEYGDDCSLDLLTIEYCKSIGWSDELKVGGAVYRICEIPVALFKRWRVPLRSRGRIYIYSPHMIVHIYAAIETGLRHQGIQWLGCDFDKEVPDPVVARAAEIIEVSTDKVKTEPFKVIISGVLLDALRYQRLIRNMVDSESFDHPVPYEGNLGSKWGAILPLFSYDLKTGRPYSDSLYAAAYKVFLVHFQRLLKANGREARFYCINPVGISYGEAFSENDVQVVCLDGDGKYCPVVIATDMSPHQSRSSSVKAWRRLLPDHAVSKGKTGQEISTLSYYDALIDEEREELRDRIGEISQVILSGGSIKPHLPNSEFYDQITRDPAKAVNAYKCISLSVGDLSVEMDGVEIVRRRHNTNLSFHPTHICAMGNSCPPEIVSHGIAKRCGLCPYCVRGVDHIVPIELKIFAMEEEIKDLHSYADELESRPDCVSDLEVLDERLSLVVAEAISWRHSHELLVSAVKSRVMDGGRFYSNSPGLIGKVLRQCDVKSDSLENLLVKLCQFEDFPGLKNEVVRAKFKSLHASLMAGVKRGLLTNGLDVPASEKGTLHELVAIIRGAISSGVVSAEELVLSLSGNSVCQIA